ncbi:S41 family peptidase [Rhizosphaericola mali]|uniref:S41 family peptidase n=1 Tax=Rhizosphaericola mali TaxID=2545455 RepID=A0A5P2GA23_9BACT|nr:S41 family peptidase [Rhizosphaericola mali]QES90792.1 S41 family peptidase [Rhizosphaericola mali]
MKNKKLSILNPILFSLVMIVGMFVGFKLKKERNGASFFNNEQKTPTEEILSLINKDYVDPVNPDSLQLKAIDDLLSQLDPHSKYITPEKIKLLNEELNGEFKGMGLEFMMYQDTATVLYSIPNGPAAKAGLKLGDRLLSINDNISLINKRYNMDSIYKIIANAPGNKIQLKILKDDKIGTVEVEKSIVPLISVPAAFMLDNQTAFVRIDRFAETTYPEFMVQAERLKKQGVQNIILDLRGNGGGAFQQAVDLCDEFLADSKLVVYTEGNKVGKKEYYTKRDGLFEKGKVVLLVDEETASASEVLSGAIQDWDRGTIIGRRTFGKGLVQEQYNLTNNGALRLTIARYYTPLGRSIQKPYDKNLADYDEEVTHRFADGEVEKGDTSKNRGKAYKTPHGKVVYGGGGITPDIFIPYNPEILPTEVYMLYINGLMNQFVFKYYSENKTQIDQYGNIQQYVQQFNLNERAWTELVQFAQQHNIFIQNVKPKAKADLLLHIKAYIAKLKWQGEGFYRVMNPQDPFIQQAINVISKK